MGRDINHVIISGRVASAIELRETDSGKSVADFKLVSNRKQLPEDDPDRINFATFIKVTVWGDDALYWAGQKEGTNNEPLDKGDQVIVEGKLYADDFTPKGSDQPTSGRHRIDEANIKLMKRKVRR